MFERFTDRARRVLVLAQEEARLLGHGFIGTEHILLGLVHEGEGLAATALESLGISLAAVREKVEATIGPAARSSRSDAPAFTPRAKKVLELSLREALQLGHGFIGPEHILLGLVREGEGVAAQVLQQLAGDLGRVRERVIGLLGASASEAGTGPHAKAGAAARTWRPPWAATREEPKTVVGRRLSAEVVVAGRRPADFAGAYDQLADVASRLGLDDLEASRLHLSSVETDEGPGLRLSITHELPADEPGP